MTAAAIRRGINIQSILTRITDSYDLRLQEFNRVAGRSEQMEYLDNLVDKAQVTDPSISVLNEVTAYVISTDVSNADAVNERVSRLNDTVTQLQTDYSRVASELSSVDYQP